MKHSLNNKSIQAYTFCPYYYTNWDKHLDHQSNVISDVFTKDVRNIFIKHIQLGYVPEEKHMAVFWRKSGVLYREEGLTVHKTNSLYMSTGIALSEYRSIFEDMDLIASDLYLPIELYEGSYTGLVDFVFLKDDNSLVPVFFEDDRNYSYPTSSGVNFNLYAFIRRFEEKDLDVNEYYTVKISRKSTHASYIRHEVEKKPLEATEKYLKNILKSIHLGLVYPNTGNCELCKYKEECNPWK